MKKLSNYEIDLLEKASRAMCGGPISQYPELLKILKDRGLIFSTEENQPTNRFIPEFREILKLTTSGEENA